MKLPEKPPYTSIDILGKLPKEKVLQVIAPNAELKAFFKKANAEYYYWDKFKQLVPKGTLNTEEAWLALKCHRHALAMPLPFMELTQAHPFHYFVTPTMQSLLSRIDQYAAGTLTLDDHHDLRAAGNERFIISSLMEEAIASSQIEGAATTRAEAKRILRADEKPVNKDQRMIVNNYQTILAIRERWQKEKLTPELIQEIHKSMTGGTLRDQNEEGRFRTPKDDDEGLAVYDEEKTLLHKPPPAVKITGLVKVLCEFANDDHRDENFIHPVIKAGILHFWLAYIHPFVDGNGRTARAIFYWFMLRHKYWLFEYIPISRIILNARRQYERAFLYSEFDSGDLNYFLMNQLIFIDKAIEAFKDYVGRKREEDQQSITVLRHHPALNRRQGALLMHAVRHPAYAYTLKGHQTACGIVYETARKDLMGLVRMGFLEMRTKQKQFIFLPVRNLEKRIRSGQDSK